MLFETIKIEDGNIFNIKWHNKRFNKSRLKLFGLSNELDLLEYINNYPQSGLYRCKITYDKHPTSIEFFPYQEKKFYSFEVVSSNIDYKHKYLDRTLLNSLKTEKADEIIIEKEGLLTDTSIANLALFNGKAWLTPEQPLLEGTTRARLLQENFLQAAKLTREDLKKSSHFALMNSMIGFSIQKSVEFRL